MMVDEKIMVALYDSDVAKKLVRVRSLGEAYQLLSHYGG